jgi:hypothetical protein
LISHLFLPIKQMPGASKNKKSSRFWEISPLF